MKTYYFDSDAPDVDVWGKCDASSDEEAKKWGEDLITQFGLKKQWCIVYHESDTESGLPLVTVKEWAPQEETIVS